MTTHDAILAITNSPLLSELTPPELRVLLVYVARADKHGVSWPSADKIAKQIGVKDTSNVTRARQGLIARGLLEKVERQAYETAYRVKLPGAIAKDASDASMRETHECVPSIDASDASDECVPRIPKVRATQVTNKDEPIQEPIQEPTPVKAASTHATSASTGPEAIYAAYPRKVGKAYGIKAIKSALKKLRDRGEPPRPSPSWTAWLLARTKAYAAHRAKVIAAGKSEPQFTPHPSTWFNRGSFDDELEPIADSEADDDHDGYLTPACAPGSIAEELELYRQCQVANAPAFPATPTGAHA